MEAVIWLLLALLAGCGLDVVELAPGLDGDTLIIGDVPSSAITRLASEDAMADPKMLMFMYPADGVALPADLAPIRFQWMGGPKMDTVYELRLRGASAALRVYTQASDVIVPNERWSAFLARVVNEDVQVELRSLELKGKGLLHGGEVRTLRVRAALAAGPIYALGKTVVQARISDSATSPSQEPSERAQGALDARARLARAMGNTIEIVDGTRTAVLRAPEGARVAHPSWAADGNALAFTYWPPELMLADDANDDREGASIARFTLSADLTGSFSVLAPNGRKPRYSPDGRWLVYEGAAKMDASLFLVSSAGGPARRIGCAGAMMKPKDEAGGAPAWLGSDWLGFIASSGEMMKHQQLWLTELDLNAAMGDVPCSTPLWLPFQSPDEDYSALSL